MTLNSVNPHTDICQYPERLTAVNQGDCSPLLGDSSIRAERTPGAAAVSASTGEGRGPCRAPTSPDPEQIEAERRRAEYRKLYPPSPGGEKAIINGDEYREMYSGLEPSPRDAQINSVGCGGRVILSECESGQHIFAKRIVCGKEWCAECGQDDSKAHNRRIARIIPKATQIEHMGEFVIEFPDRYRKLKGWGYSKEALRQATNKTVAVLAGKRMGRRGRVGGYFGRGLVRWHWFGDKIPGKWNPHMEVLVDSRWLDLEKIKEIQGVLAEALKCPDLIVHYGYLETPKEKYAKVRYVTRATFRQYEWDPYMAEQLFNFRNQRWWGSWKDEPAWNVSQVTDDVISFKAVNSLQGGLCPCCGGKLKVLRHGDHDQPVVWSTAIDSRWLSVWGAEEYGNTGYYRIPVREWNGDIFSPADLLYLERLKQAERDNPTIGNVDVALLASRHAKRKYREYEDEAWWQHTMQENQY